MRLEQGQHPALVGQIQLLEGKPVMFPQPVKAGFL